VLNYDILYKIIFRFSFVCFAVISIVLILEIAHSFACLFKSCLDLL